MPVLIYDDFLSATPAGLTIARSNATVQAGAVAEVAKLAPFHPGWLTFATGTSSSGYVAVTTDGGQINGSGGSSLMSGGCRLIFETISLIHDLSEPEDSYEVSAGYGDQAAERGAARAGAAFYYCDDLNNGRWTIQTQRDSSPGISIDTGIEVTSESVTPETAPRYLQRIEIGEDGAGIFDIQTLETHGERMVRTASFRTIVAPVLMPVPGADYFTAMIKMKKVTGITAGRFIFWDYFWLERNPLQWRSTKVL